MALKECALSLLLAMNAAVAEPRDYEIIKVVDGDTIKVKVDFLPAELKPELSVRINGIDTPEKAPRAKCKAEAEKALAASAFTKKTIAAAHDTKVVIEKWDKYGGRVLGDVIVDGVSLRELLLKSGLAREYHGEAKQSWCK